MRHPIKPLPTACERLAGALVLAALAGACSLSEAAGSNPPSVAATVTGEDRAADESARRAHGFRKDDAIAAFRAGDHERALRIFRLLAEDGDAEAMLNVGMLTRAEDPEGARRLFERAARAGNPHAAYELGLVHANSGEVGLEAGIAWLIVAQAGGNERAGGVLADMQRQLPERTMAEGRRRGAQLQRELSGSPAAPTARRDVETGVRAEAPRADAALLKLKRTELRDPQTNDMVSHHVLVPDGWRVTGGVTWTPAVLNAFVHLESAISAPDGREVRFLPNGAFTFADGSLAGPAPARPGEVTHGKVWMAPASSPAEFVVQSIVPFARPDATNVRVLSQRRMEQVEQEWRRALAPAIESQRQANAMMAQSGMGGGIQSEIQAPLIRVEYEEAGRRFHEEFSMVYVQSTSTMDTGWSGWARSTDWSVYEVKSVRAPAGRFEAEEPLLRTIATSLRPTETWQAFIDQETRAVLNAQRRTHTMMLSEIRKRSKAVAQLGDDIRAMNRDSWERQQASSDRLARAWSNTIRGVDDYTSPDGEIWSLDSTYEHVFTNSLGEFVFTNDHMYDPNQHSSQEWHRMQRIEPMGGAANW